MRRRTGRMSALRVRRGSLAAVMRGGGGGERARGQVRRRAGRMSAWVRRGSARSLAAAMRGGGTVSIPGDRAAIMPACMAEGQMYSMIRAS